MQDAPFSHEDLRAAVAAGTLTEPQAAAVIGLAQARLNGRQAMAGEDEPFEFFRGFAEIFIAVGLIILISGIVALMALVGMRLAIPLGLAVLAWWLAEYFTLKRRMVLPSIVLLGAFGIGVGGAVLSLQLQQAWPNPVSIVQLVTLTGAAAMAIWYWRFRLPIAMFFLGLSLLAALYVAWASPADVIAFWESGSIEGLFDLSDSSGFGLATLGFGVAAFVAAMCFDMRDPYRLGRMSSSGFWLHVLAAPALVNTVALSLLNIGGTVGFVALAAALGVISILALVIDRRSFVTAGVVYFGFVIAWLIRGDGEDALTSWAAILIVLGMLITALGTFWTPLRATLMRALPDFPGKRRLPPFAETP